MLMFKISKIHYENISFKKTESFLKNIKQCVKELPNLNSPNQSPYLSIGVFHIDNYCPKYIIFLNLFKHLCKAKK